MRRQTLSSVDGNRANSRASLGPARMSMAGPGGGAAAKRGPAGGRRKSSAGRQSLSRRSSAYGGGGGTARKQDPRPIKDKAFMNSTIKQVIVYLSQSGYDCPISPKVPDSRPAPPPRAAARLLPRRRRVLQQLGGGRGPRPQPCHPLSVAAWPDSACADLQGLRQHVRLPLRSAGPEPQAQPDAGRRSAGHDGAPPPNRRPARREGGGSLEVLPPLESGLADSPLAAARPRHSGPTDTRSPYRSRRCSRSAARTRGHTCWLCSAGWWSCLSTTTRRTARSMSSPRRTRRSSSSATLAGATRASWPGRTTRRRRTPSFRSGSTCGTPRSRMMSSG